MVDKNTLNDDLITVDDDDFDDFEVIDVNEIKDRIADIYVQKYENEKAQEAADKENKDDKKPSYELVFHSGLKEGEEPLGRVIGHTNQKKEILDVVDWFKRSKELKARGVSIPKVLSSLVNQVMVSHC